MYKKPSRDEQREIRETRLTRRETRESVVMQSAKAREPNFPKTRERLPATDTDSHSASCSALVTLQNQNAP